MRQAIMRVQHFDHILIDTPPMPLQKASAAKLVRHVKMLVDPIMPLRVQFVLNTTRSLEDFTPGFIGSLPLRPETIALTHLDETQGWGRIAEWLMSLKMPVQFISTNAAVPDGVSSFSPTWFVEEMMKL
jgi:flagellar biosynthesis protein FlhF